MTEEPDTIDPVEFLRSSAIKWQNHARLSYALIEIYRDNPAYFDNRDILLTQETLRTESTVAMERLFRYIDALAGKRFMDEAWENYMSGVGEYGKLASVDDIVNGHAYLGINPSVKFIELTQEQRATMEKLKWISVGDSRVRPNHR